MFTCGYQDFGVDSEGKIVFCYGTSSYRIDYASWTDFDSKVLYGYMLSGENLNNGIPSVVDNYIENTFEPTDGLAGIWVNISDTSKNSEKENIILKEFETFYTIEIDRE